jgi:hypothetical protein
MDTKKMIEQKGYGHLTAYILHVHDEESLPASPAYNLYLSCLWDYDTHSMIHSLTTQDIEEAKCHHAQCKEVAEQLIKQAA